MKEQINLLPPTAKQARRRRLYRTRGLYLGRRAFGGLIILWVVMAGIYWLTWQRQQEVVSATLAQTKNGGDVLKEVEDVNRLLSVINGWVAAHPAWSPVLEDVLATVPAGARLTIVALQFETQGLAVKGVAGNRGAVLEMQRQLEGLPWVERVEAPLQNFASDASGEFAFTLFRRADNEPK